MNIALGENIKRLRRDRQLTQEQLAEALEVSFQAVSKWETEASYPDIQLLPVIADFFDVSVDTLLGMDAARKEEEIVEIFNHSHELMHEGKAYENMCYLREKQKEYPHNPELMHSLAGAITTYYFYGGRKYEFDEDERRKAADEALELCKRAIKYSNDGNSTVWYKLQMVRIYTNMDEKVKAKEIVDTLPNIWSSWNLNITHTLPEAEAFQYYQNNVLTGLQIAINELGHLGYIGSYVLNEYSPQQKLEIEQLREKLIFAVIGEKTCSFSKDLFYISNNAAWEYMRMKEYDKAAECMEKSLKYAEDFARFEVNGECQYDAFWLSRLGESGDNMVKSSEKNVFDELEQHLNGMCEQDAELGNNERFKELRDKVAEIVATQK